MNLESIITKLGVNLVISHLKQAQALPEIDNACVAYWE